MPKKSEHKQHRDLVGYGSTPPNFRWPKNARIAVSLVVNYEEGAESSPLYGDSTHEIIGDIHSDKPAGVRDLANESQWEYGARSGSWRILRCLAQNKTKATFFVCAQALERNPEFGEEIARKGHDICGHGYRWGQQWHLPRAKEKELVHKTIESVKRITGKRMIGWFARGGLGPNSRNILREEGLLYDCNAYNDDIPYFVDLDRKPWLVLPYAFDTNDMKYWSGGSTGWDNANSYFEYLKDSFDVLYAEGENCAKMLSVGLHTRILGRPGRSIVLERFIKYASQFPDVWFAGRDEIAHWWLENYSPK
ncbi:MAG: polysaccharide deacetylase family protein [Nitrososphaerales archaeon]